ncbi:chemotaxis protein CheX [Geobacter sp. FeAm09]|uniref:chemotaxis protein CheX n=1 Tax=Geobacter sp. FeAm09 TaxID=2597769 RepID=UPI0011ECB192|nr:chemotaxis protein CheX [Geobacter sp. FeAm09]QEM67449.1 chemotaxis protein CheX [Geobacter sp. FeAm09]
MSLNAAIYEQLGTDEGTLVAKFHQDIEGIFTTMVGIEDLSAAPVLADPTTHFSHSVTAMVGFAGLFNGLLSLHVPQTLALRFTSGMLGMEVTELDDDVNDALGEIANMVAGSFKHHLSREGHEVRLSTPSVVTGGEYEIASGSLADTLALRYHCGGEPFMISLVVEME